MRGVKNCAFCRGDVDFFWNNPMHIAICAKNSHWLLLSQNLWWHRMHVKDVVCIVFDLIGLLTNNHLLLILQWHTRVYAETFDVNIKIVQTMQISWHVIVRKLSLLKKWQTLAIIQEISYSNWRTGEMVQNLESLWIILESWQLCDSDICLLLRSTIINLPIYLQA